jgi:hypothetical protein
MNRIHHYHSPFPEARPFLAQAKELKTLTMNQLTKIQICSNAPNREDSLCFLTRHERCLLKRSNQTKQPVP